MLILVPRKHGKYIDAIEIQDRDGYPSAIVHIDTFWQGHKSALNDIHDRLNNGETLKVNLEIIEEE